MIKIINSKEDLNILKGENIGTGREGTCYRNNDIVLKIYSESPKDLLFMGSESPYFAFPVDIYKDNNDNILAHTMKYIDGIKIDNGFPEHLEINKLIEAYNVFLNEISKYPNIYMSDLCLDNIFYNEYTNRFYLIDTTLWKDWSDSLGLNIARLNQNLSHALYLNISWIAEYDFWKNNNDFKRNFIESKNEGFVNFIDFLNQTIEVLSKFFDKEIISIGDLREKSKKIS